MPRRSLGFVVTASVGLVGLVVATYLATNLLLPQLSGGFVAAYVMRPGLWLLVALSTLLVWRRGGRVGLRFSAGLVPVSLLLGTGHVCVLVIAGVLLGFGHSPYDHTARGIVINVAFVAAPLAGVELSRAYLLGAPGKRTPLVGVGLVALFYALVGIPLGRLVGLIQGSALESIPFVASALFPSLAESLLASYLALDGGPLAAIAYRGALQAFEWFSPILPDLPWMVKALVGTSLPILGFLIVEALAPLEAHPAEAQPHTSGRSPVMGWLVVGLAGLVLLWFSLGLLPVRPVLVGGGSMEPHMYLGDVAVVRKISADRVGVGDVVQYKHEGTMVLHRVIAVRGEGGSKAFTTRGDNNDVADAKPVQPSQVVGKLLLVVPKLGWVAIAARDPLGLGLLIGLPAVLLLAAEARTLCRRRRREAMPQSNPGGGKQ